MKTYNIIFLLGSIITLIGAVLLVLVDRLERGGPGLLILLLGMVIATYGLVLRVFNQVFKKDSMYVLFSAHQSPMQFRKTIACPFQTYRTMSPNAWHEPRMVTESIKE